MPGVRVNLPIELEPAAAAADAPEHVEPAPEAVPSPPAPEEVSEAPEDKAHVPSVPAKPRARK